MTGTWSVFTIFWRPLTGRWMVREGMASVTWSDEELAAMPSLIWADRPVILYVGSRHTVMTEAARLGVPEGWE